IDGDADGAVLGTSPILSNCGAKDKMIPFGFKKAVHYGALLLLVIIAVGPFLWLLSTALKSGEENIFAYPPQLLPEAPTLENFTQVWQQAPMASYFFNSIVVAILTVAFNLVFSTLAAYPLARMQFRGQQAIFLAILATMMIPFQVIMIPLYLIMLKAGLTDTANPVQLCLPNAVGGLCVSLNTVIGLAIPFAISGFGIFFMRQALINLPKELEESAVMDGCNSFQVLYKVIVPLVKPALATLAVFTFMTSWGEFLWPSILLSDPQNYTLPVGLVHLQGAFSANWRLIAAGTMMSMIPILVFFLLLQRYFVSGSLAGSVKG
nr:carbohydrate ABC transporter permease [Vampirovibrio sp.]